MIKKNIVDLEICFNLLRDYLNLHRSPLKTCWWEIYTVFHRKFIRHSSYHSVTQVFDKVPPPDEFLKDYKSPCWQRSSPDHADRVQCLPYFYLAGMPKCGTTDIWAKTNSHNGVFGTAKEPHWWTRSRLSGKTFSIKRWYQWSFKILILFFFYLKKKKNTGMDFW